MRACAQRSALTLSERQQEADEAWRFYGERPARGLQGD
jgi:hypothetical protein